MLIGKVKTSNAYSHSCLYTDIVCLKIGALEIGTSKAMKSILLNFRGSTHKNTRSYMHIVIEKINFIYMCVENHTAPLLRLTPPSRSK